MPAYVNIFVDFCSYSSFMNGSKISQIPEICQQKYKVALVTSFSCQNFELALINSGRHVKLKFILVDIFLIALSWTKKL